MVHHDPDHEAIRDLLGAYALGAVEVDERRAVEAHLEVCASCRNELAGHAEAIAGLTKVTAELGPDRAAHLMELDGGDQAEAHTLAPPRARALPRGRRVVMGLGIAALLLLVVSVATVTVLTRRLDRVEGRLARAEQIQQVVALAADRNTRSAHLTTSTPGVSLDVVVLADGNAMVWKNRLPALPPQRSYFLWAVVAGQRVPIGRLDPGGRPQVVRVPSGASGMIVTEEPSTGPPEGTRIIVAGGLGGEA